MLRRIIERESGERAAPALSIRAIRSHVLATTHAKSPSWRANIEHHMRERSARTIPSRYWYIDGIAHDPDMWFVNVRNCTRERECECEWRCRVATLRDVNYANGDHDDDGDDFVVVVVNGGSDFVSNSSCLAHNERLIDFLCGLEVACSGSVFHVPT